MNQLSTRKPSQIRKAAIIMLLLLSLTLASCKEKTDTTIPVPVIPTPEAGQPSATADANTTIYSGPGTNYVVYGSFLGGSQGVVVGKSEDGLWWAISVPVAASEMGWVIDSMVTVENTDSVPVIATPPVPPTTDLVPPEADDPQATALVATYVRSGPGNNYPAYGIAETGANALVIGKSVDGLWLVVRLDPKYVGAGYGWVEYGFVEAKNIDDIQVIETPELITEELPQPEPGVSTATATDYINVRTGPGLNYDVLFVAAPGASSEVTARTSDNDWVQVKISTNYAEDGLGWVSYHFVSIDGIENVPVIDVQN